MADTQNISDLFADNLESQISGLGAMLADPDTGLENKVAAEEKAIADRQKQLDNYRSSLTKQLAREFLGTSESASAEIDAYRFEASELREAIILARQQKTDGLSAGYLLYAQAAYLENLNLDKVISDWLDTLKGKQGKKLDAFLFGSKKPPKIATAPENKDAFATGDWLAIIKAYNNELDKREEIITKAEDRLQSLAGANFKETFAPTQPDKTKLNDLLAQRQNFLDQKSALEKRLAHYRELRDKNRLYLRGIAEGRWTEEEVERGARDLAQEQIEKEERPKEEVAPTAGERVNLPATRPPITKVPQGSKEKRPTTKMAVITAEGEEIPIWTFRDVLRHPFSFLEYQAGRARSYVGQLFSKGGKKAAEKVVIKAGVQKVEGAIAKRGLSLLLSKVAAKFIPIMGWLSLAKDILFSKRVREALLGAGVAAMIFLQMAINFLVSSAWMAGGAVVGFFVGGPVGAAIGAGVGYVVGPSIGSAISSLLSGGATTATEIGAATTGGVTTVTSGISGISAAVATGAAPVFIAISVTIIGTIITIIATASAFVAATTPDDGSHTEGVSFSISKTALPTSVENGVSSPVVYSVTITATNDLSGITVDDKFSRENANGSSPLSLTPEEAFPTSLAKGETKTVKFQPFITTDADKDSNLVNVLTVTTNNETLSAQATVTVGNPNYTASRCSIGLETGFCSVQKLLPYFKDNQTVAENASRICVAESEGIKNPSRLGKPNVINDSCDPKYNLPPEKRREYSVGLFQINLWAHSNFCLQVPDITENPFNKPYKKGCAYPDCDPCDRNQTLVDKCAAYWMELNQESVQFRNFQWAAENSNYGTKWFPTWSTADPKYCNIP